MLFKSLPEKNSKGEANTVEITNRKLDPNSEDGRKFVIPGPKVEFPQVENFEEFYQLCGGQDRALEIANEFLKDAATTEVKNSVRMASTGTEEEIILAAISKGKNFTFLEGARMSAGEAKEKFQNLRALAIEKNLSDEELAAQVRAMLSL